MNKVRAKAKPVSCFLAIFMILMVTPFHAVIAGMINVETMVASQRASDARAYVDQVLSREEVRSAFIAQGIDAEEAMSRTRALSDAEIVRLAEQMDRLPAGAGTTETVIVVLFIVFLVLLFTDIAGATDIFPFVRK